MMLHQCENASNLRTMVRGHAFIGVNWMDPCPNDTLGNSLQESLLPCRLTKLF